MISSDGANDLAAISLGPGAANKLAENRSKHATNEAPPTHRSAIICRSGSLPLPARDERGEGLVSAFSACLGCPSARCFVIGRVNPLLTFIRVTITNFISELNQRWLSSVFWRCKGFVKEL